MDAAWQPIDTAPKDGTVIWGWLYDTGITALRWMSAEEAAAGDGDRYAPAEYEAGWVRVYDTWDYWTPKWWLPYETIGVPPGVVCVGGKWRDSNTDIGGATP